MDNVNHLNELSIQSQLSTLEKLVADAEQSTDARRDFEAQPRAVFQKYGITDLQNQSGKSKSLCTNWWSQPKRRRVSPLHAQHIVVSSSHRPRHLDGGSSASPGKEKRGPSGPRPRPPPISPRDVNRPARLAVVGLGVSEPDSDGGPSAGTRQRVGLGPRGGDESLELGRSGRRGPHLERVAAARLVLDDDRRAERLLEGRALSPKPLRILVLLGRFVLLPAPEEVVPEQGHWETDYGQVWIPNVVYVRHERYWINHGGTKVGPFDSKAAAWAWCDNDVDNGGIGGSVIDDSYTTSEDQGHYEQQATGRHWVVDVAGHWE